MKKQIIRFATLLFAIAVSLSSSAFAADAITVNSAASLTPQNGASVSFASSDDYEEKILVTYANPDAIPANTYYSVMTIDATAGGSNYIPNKDSILYFNQVTSTADGSLSFYVYPMRLADSAIIICGEGIQSLIAGIIDVSEPENTFSIPVIELVTREDGKPRIKWAAVEGAVKYQIWRSTNGGEFVKQYTTSYTSYSNTAAKEGYTYSYKVCAVAEDGTTSDFSNVVDFDYTIGLDAPVAELVIREDGKPRIKWAAVEGAVKYQIWRSTNGGEFVKQYTTSYTSYSNTAAKEGYTYSYKVCAVAEDSTTSDFSNVVVFNYSSSANAPVIELVARADGKPRIKWGAVAGAVEYQIWRSTNGGEFVKLYTTSYTSFSNTSVQEGNTYSYKVCAVVEGGTTSDFSNVVNAVYTI